MQPCDAARLFARRLHRQDETEPDETLLETRTAPDDAGSRTRVKTDGVHIGHIGRVAEEGNQFIDDRSYMTGHELKRGGDVPPEPGDRIAILIPDHRPFPGIVRYQQRHHENDNVLIWL